MQSLLQFKYLAIICIIVQPLIVIAEDQENLGLITNIGIFKLATDIEKIYLSVTVLANSSLDTFSSYINRINNSAHSPANIAGLKADKDLRAKFYEGFFPGSTALWDIAVDLEIISSYKHCINEILDYLKMWGQGESFLPKQIVIKYTLTCGGPSS